MFWGCTWDDPGYAGISSTNITPHSHVYALRIRPNRNAFHREGVCDTTRRVGRCHLQGRCIPIEFRTLTGAAAAGVPPTCITPRSQMYQLAIANYSEETRRSLHIQSVSFRPDSRQPDRGVWRSWLTLVSDFSFLPMLLAFCILD